MKRRSFLKLAASSSLLPLAGSSSRRPDDLAKHRITKITGFSHRCPRPKFVGKNSHLDDHGDSTGDRVLRVFTSEGAEGVGSGAIEKERAEALIGRTVADVWSDERGSVGGFGRADHALFDLVGKIRGVPAWRLIGDAGPTEVDVYDGSIYFNDLLPQHAKAGVARLVEEAEQGLDRGFRAFKIKVGRGFKWMPQDAGFERDVEVVTAIRKRVGPDVRLMVDANNGFDLDTTKRWLDRVGELDLYFVEEMFPEQVDLDVALRDFIKEKGWRTLVADGESAREVAHFDEYLLAGAIDVVQPDIRAFGLSKQWEMSKRIDDLGGRAKLAPHNWGSFLGFYMQLQLARAIGNFAMAECDWSTSDLFDTSAYSWGAGKVSVPDVPGCGLVLREEVFRQKYQAEAWTVGA